MKILIAGICGFTGSTLARTFQEFDSNVEVSGIDNFLWAGSELNRSQLKTTGVRVLHGDVRCPSDFDLLPKVDWVVDAAANPSVLAGVTEDSSSRQLLEHNLVGTINLLDRTVREPVQVWLMLIESRVYSIVPLARLPVRIENDAYHPNFDSYSVVGLSGQGVSEKFSTAAPVSLYGATKLASEVLALEYAEAFGVPVWINRCGVMAGPGQFGKPDQGIFAFWINSYLRRRPLRYIGFDGRGLQVRDCLHPRDVAALAWKQMQSPVRSVERVQNVGGGIASAMSLAQLTAWCAARFGKHPVESDSSPRRYDIPWLVLDATKANQQWDWRPTVTVEQILEEIAQHAEAHPEWLEVSGCE